MRIFVDTNVWMSSVRTRIFRKSHELELCSIVWSDTIWNELSKKRNVRYSPKHLPRVVNWLQEYAELRDAKDYKKYRFATGTTDKKDIDIAAAAIGAKVEVLATKNLKDFDGDALKKHGIRLSHVDIVIEELAKGSQYLTYSMYQDTYSYSTSKVRQFRSYKDLIKQMRQQIRRYWKPEGRVGSPVADFLCNSDWLKIWCREKLDETEYRR